VYEILVENDILMVTNDGRIANAVNLAKVDSIWAIKKNMITYDEIFLVLSQDGRYLWIGELTKGFRQADNEIARRYPILEPNWYGKLNEAEPFTESRVLLFSAV
jgi:hypothetical protein